MFPLMWGGRDLVARTRFLRYNPHFEARECVSCRQGGKPRTCYGNASRAPVADNQEDDMRLHLVATLCAAAMGFAALSSAAYAQQKTVKACEDEWQAKKALRRGAVPPALIALS